MGRLLAFGSVVLLGFANGGAAATSWGWAAVCFSSLIGFWLIVRPRRPAAKELAFLGGLVLLTAWTALSAVWSESVPASLLEVERDLVYVTVVGAALMLPRDELADGILGGCVVLCAWNLLVRLHGYDASLVGANAAPVGYANGLGLLGAIGSILALRRRATWVALGVLVPVIVLSGSTGSMLALACALVVSWRARLAPLVAVAAALVVLVGLQGHLRTPYWNVALADAHAHVVHGSGAGTFAEQWVQRRAVAHSTIDAHSLELQTLAELGVVGLVLLAAALVWPFVGGEGLVLGAYAAWIVQSGIDWDWQLPAVTVAGLLCGVAALRPTDVRRASLGRRSRAIALAGALAVAALAIAGLAGNVAIARAQGALRSGDTAAAIAEARTARRWAPWSSKPWEVVSEARGGNPDALRHAIALDPNDWQLWSELAASTTGGEARRAALRAARLNPLGAQPSS